MKEENNVEKYLEQNEEGDLIESAMMRLVHREPFYANLLMNMKRHYVTDIPTVGVNVTDTVNIYVNPYFWKNLKIEEQVDILKHECIAGNCLIDTDKGTLRMKDIVDNKLKVKVKSVNKQTGKIEFKKITNWMVKDIKNYPNKRWVSVKYTSSPYLYSTVICTNDHKIACIKNPLKQEIDFVRADQSVGLYSLRNVDNVRNKNKENAAYNKDQLQVIIGCLLGDGCIDKQGMLSQTGSLKHKKYNDYKKEILGGYTQNIYSGTSLKLCNGVNEQSKFLRKLIYKEGKKDVNFLINNLTEVGLAFWYMDDGNWNQYGYTKLHTERFDLTQNELLKARLEEKFELKCTIKKRKDKNLYYLLLKKDSTDKLFRLIAPYIHPSMNYKIKDIYRDQFDPNLLNKDRLGYSLLKIKEVKDRPSTRSYLYDITVEDNHNFFANNTLVSNCHHVVNNHFVRFRDIDPHLFDKMEKKLVEKGDKAEDVGKKLVDKLNAQTEFRTLNQAADYAINEYLPNLPKKMKFFDKDGNPIVEPEEIPDGKGGMKKNKNAGKPVEGEPCLVSLLKKKYKDVEHQKNMEYYHEFLKEKQQQGGDGQDAQNGGTRVVVIDDHGIWSEGDQDEEYVTEKVRDVVNKAVEQTKDDSRSAGSIPQELLQAIEELNHVPRNWKQDLRRFVARTAETVVESTRKRRNRRYGIVHPGTKVYPTLHLALLTDFSGSVSDEEAFQFFAEMYAICRLRVKVTWIEFDAKVNNVQEFNRKSKPAFHGRGGTHFKPAFEEAAKHNVDGIICFTDGGDCYKDCPKPKVPVLWALTGRKDVEKWFKDNMYNWGNTTRVEIKKKK